VTKIRHSGDSSMIEDRRGQSSGGGRGGMSFPGLGGGGGGRGGSGFPFPMKAGGGMVGILMMLAVFLLPKLLSGGGLGSATGAGGNVAAPNLSPDPAAGQVSTDSESDGDDCDTETAQIICGAVIDVQTFWIEQFKASGREYQLAPTVFFSGQTDTGCGPGQAGLGPFYCPLDSRVYFDLDFLVELQDRFSAGGDLAAQYIVAHEYGHHIQNVLGISDQVRQSQRSNPSQANALSVRLELQADCLAGVWASDAQKRGKFESEREIDEAINAAGAVGDDRIQRQTQGRVDPESFTHGSSEQRQTWFKRGYRTGDSAQCDTFSE
jgi:uncharacterized protein